MTERQTTSRNPDLDPLLAEAFARGLRGEKFLTDLFAKGRRDLIADANNEGLAAGAMAARRNLAAGAKAIWDETIAAGLGTDEANRRMDEFTRKAN